MRLICGLARFDGAPVDRTALESMCRALSSPGLAPAILTRLGATAAFAVLDFAHGARPGDLPVAENGTWLAADVRLNEVGDKNEERTTLETFDRWGEDLPGHLDGDYALAFWDPRESRVTLARDIMGVRPLCYAHVPGKLFAFASIPRGLHGSSVIEPKLDVIALGIAQVQLHLHPDDTGWDGIQWLLPAHTLTVNAAGLHTRRAWKPDASLVGTWRGSAKDAAAELRRLVENAVACRLRGTGPVAAHISGGLDSSAIAVIAARKLRGEGRKLHGYSIVTHPSQPVFSEQPWVDAVLAQEPDIDWTPEYLPSEPPNYELPRDPDLPLSLRDSPEEWISSKAASTGAQLLLSGVGGDEAATYNGPDPYAELVRQGKLLTALNEVRARARVDDRPLWRTIYGRLVQPFLPGVERMRRRKRGQTVVDDLHSRTARFFSTSFREKVLTAKPKLPPLGNHAEDRIRRLTAGLDMRGNDWAIMGARSGIAISYPLADRPILEFCLSLPLERILEGGYSRQPFRNAMRGILPDKVRLRNDKFAGAPAPASRVLALMALRLARVELLRGRREVEELFDLDAIGTSIQDAARRADDPNLPSDFGDQPTPGWLLNAKHADRALTIAEYVARSFL